jgi:hypothetical protein
MIAVVDEMVKPALGIVAAFAGWLGFRSVDHGERLKALETNSKNTTDLLNEIRADVKKLVEGGGQ